MAGTRHRQLGLTRGLRLIGAALAVLLCSQPGHVQAGTATANLTVQITIAAACTIAASTLNFGAAVSGTTLATTPTTASTTISVTCTSGSAFSVGMDNGANASGAQRRMKNGTNFINYGLYLDAGLVNPWTTGATSTTCTTVNQCSLGTGTGSAQSITVFGQVPATTTAPPVGTYNDTVVMTITF